MIALMMSATLAVAAPADDATNAGLAAMRRMDVVAAMAAFTQALEHQPRHSEAAYQRGRIFLKMGEPQKAIVDFTTAVLAQPDLGRGFARRGEAKIILKNWAAAFEDFDQAVAVSPRDYEVFVIRATYKFKRGELAGAVADMEAAILVADSATSKQLKSMLAKMQSR